MTVGQLGQVVKLALDAQAELEFPRSLGRPDRAEVAASDSILYRYNHTTSTLEDTPRGADGMAPTTTMKRIAVIPPMLVVRRSSGGR